MLECLHVLLECRCARVNILIDLLVIDQRTDGALTLIDLAGD